ncbi:MAG: hypothetical protein JKY13_01200 [Gammaproteobacteria bacterium]|nr:hypothetical protein [Gammaproteobacteria bacterium]
MQISNIRQELSKDLSIVDSHALTGQMAFRFADAPDRRAYEYRVLKTNFHASSTLP